ncbi:MAG: long-chain fatty acid--CoA ligase [Burkholderiales bacterium]|nr:long-chain fatty acid--CoA ligase [Burkholderiales bacterium]
MQEPLLVGALGSACSRHGSRSALIGEDAALTYRDLWDQASGLARELAASGSVEHAPVVVRCSNHPTDFVAFLGVWMAGGLAAPVHRSSPAEVVRAIQAKAQCTLSVDLLSQQGTTQRLPVDARVQESRRRVLAGGALVIFTSGSTGRPKGVVLSHQAFHAKLAQNQRLFQAEPDTTALLVLNDTFSFGIWVALMTLMQGGKVAMLGRFTPQALVHALCQEHVSFLGVVPTMVRATFGTLTAPELAEARSRIAATGRLRRVVIGGEPLGRQLSAELREFIAPAELFDVYGLTETCTSDFVLQPSEYAAHPDSIGRPFPGIRYRLIDSEGEECRPGSVGELQLATPYIMAGYLGDEALTAQAFSNGWFRTGDLASVDGEGFVSIAGRLKELIVRGANKITPLEVEMALLQVDGVASAMVTGMPDPILGERIHALLVARPGARLDLPAIRQALAIHLEKFKAPDVFYIGDTLPTGRTGKLDRGLLQRLVSSGAVKPLAE